MGLKPRLFERWGTQTTQIRFTVFQFGSRFLSSNEFLEKLSSKQACIVKMGRQGSNLRMSGSKPDALPLGYAPMRGSP